MRRTSSRRGTAARPGPRCGRASGAPWRSSLAARLARQRDLRDDVGGEVLEQLDLPGTPRARLAVEDAEGAERAAARFHERDARVGDEAHVPDREVLAQHVVIARILDDQGLATGYGVLAEGIGQRRLPLRRPRLGQSEAALEELAVGVDERHERD